MNSDAKPALFAGVSLVIAAVVMAGLLAFGPGLVEQTLVPLLGTDASEAAIEALFVLALFGTIVAVALLAGVLSKRHPAAPGARPMASLLLGLGIGLLGILIALSYSAIAGTLRNGIGEVDQLLLIAGVFVILLQVAAEELYFRGWLQPVLAEAWGVVPAIVIVSILFAALHLLGGASSPLALVNLLLGGMLFGLLAARTGGIAAALGAHFAWNASEQLLLGLDPNPGQGVFGSVLNLELIGASNWGGAAEGLNRSVAMTMALVVLLVPLLVWKRSEAAPARPI